MPKFKLRESLMYNGKGKPISNSSEPIHSVCNSAIITQEGSNAVREWSEKRQDPRESSAKKKNKSRKDRRARAREKHGRASNAKFSKIASPCPTPAALKSVQLRRVEVDRLNEQTPASVGDDIGRNADYQQPNSEECHEDEVRSEGQRPEFVSGPLREGLGDYNVCPS